jgi:DNA polymerase
MNTPRPYEEIIGDVERWANEKLRAGEEYIVLPGAMPAAGVGNAVVNEPIIFQEETVAKTKATKAEPLAAVHEAWQDAADLPMLKSMIENCTKCELHKTRTNFVFGVGNPNAKVMVVGEAPGADEDKQGEPFVGRAGQLLNKMLAAINFPREEVFIANILKSRPPGNRDPQPEEIAACEPYLWKQIDIIKPKMILCAGRVAGINLLKNGIDTLAKLRGNVYDFRGAKVMVTYHPAALLRNPNWKQGAWEDLQKFRKLYDELVAES